MSDNEPGEDSNGRCTSFKPSCVPTVCRHWYVEIYMGNETHFCGSTKHKGKDCPTLGYNPYPIEEDSFE